MVYKYWSKVKQITSKYWMFSEDFLKDILNITICAIMHFVIFEGIYLDMSPIPEIVDICSANSC